MLYAISYMYICIYIYIYIDRERERERENIISYGCLREARWHSARAGLSRAAAATPIRSRAPPKKPTANLGTKYQDS